MTDHTSPIRRESSHDDEINAARTDLDLATTKAQGLLDPYGYEARFSLAIPMHPFHRTIQERDGTWTKQSLVELLETLNEALETRIWMSADGIFLPYPTGPKVSYPPGYERHAFDKVIRVVAPMIIRIAQVIASAEPKRHIPRTSDAKGTWHEATGFLRRITGEVREEIRIMEHGLMRRKKARPTLPPGRHLQYGGR